MKQWSSSALRKYRISVRKAKHDRVPGQKAGVNGQIIMAIV